MTKTLKSGDKVSWKTSQGETRGTVVRKVTKRETVKGHEAAASAAHTEYRVKSAKTGKEAIHLAGALHKRKGD